MTITLTETQAEEIFQEGEIDGYTYLEMSEWTDEGKCSYCDVIFKNDSGQFFELSVTRMGSYHSDYEFMYNLKCQEVEKVEVVVTQWKNKK